jgi:hypothetical protein
MTLDLRQEGLCKGVHGRKLADGTALSRKNPIDQAFHRSV